MRIAKLVRFTSLGINKRTYLLWDGSGTLSFEGANWQGVDSDISLSSIGNLSFSLNEISHSIGVELVVTSIDFLTDISFGSALSEATIILIYRDEDGWKRCPVSFRGLVGEVSRTGKLVNFSVDSGDIDRDRIYPKIWSHQSQLREYPNDQGFRFLPVMVKGFERNFLKNIDSRE